MMNSLLLFQLLNNARFILSFGFYFLFITMMKTSSIIVNTVAGIVTMY